jgi:ATP-dependent protease ClpP protease subunit
MTEDWIGFVGPQYDDWYMTESEAELKGITVARFRNAWAQLKADDDFTINLSSEGGYSDVGVSIMNLVRNESAKRRLMYPDFKSIVNVIGTAYSAGSIICMGFDEIQMCLGSEMMIHRASTYAWGNVDTLEKTVAMLKSIDASIADIYAHRTGLPVDKISSLLQDETFLSADEAVKLKLATRKYDVTASVAPPSRPTNWSYSDHMERNMRVRNGTVAFFSPRPTSSAPQAPAPIPISAESSRILDAMLSK